MSNLEPRLRRAQVALLYVFLASAVLTVALGLVAVWAEIVPEGLFGKLLVSAALVMVVSALGVSAARLVRE